MTAINDRDEWAKALGGEYGGRVTPSGLAWECVCGANGIGGARGLHAHRQKEHQNGGDRDA